LHALIAAGNFRGRYGGLGRVLNACQAGLARTKIGADGWAMTPAGLRGVVNDAIAIDLFDATVGRRLCVALARWINGRDQQRGVPGGRVSAGSAASGDAAQDVMN
jgi:hypothetical protein